ncbi:MAG TPA: GMC oxidoreductase [Planctomycetota bacterium]|nr:GMC oxidoreductase [Planctomycetota bacterium]
MKSVTVVGSGASAVHFAQTALERGWRVTLLDFGRARPRHLRPELSFEGLKEHHPRSSEYFLGHDFQGVLFPGAKGEYYGFPPHRDYVFAPHPLLSTRAAGLDPLMSYARGGLAEAWTGAVFPFSDAELRDWPISHADLAPHYDLVAKRIGIAGALDDLERFVPSHAHLDEPLELDLHSQRLSDRYTSARAQLNQTLGVFVGRTRAAVLTKDRGERKACDFKGRCLWGCPNDSIYSPLYTLQELERNPDFRYVPGVFVRHFELDDGGQAGALAVEHTTGVRERIPIERLVLAAGTLASARILLESMGRASDSKNQLGGLMDNRQVLVPFVNWSMLRERAVLDSYQYHQLALGMTSDDPREYVHGLITTLKSALIHPIAQQVPFDLRTALDLTRSSHAALGLVNLNFHDTRRVANRVELEREGGKSRLVLHYAAEAGEVGRIQVALKRLKSALRLLGCFVPPGMTHVRPMGASVHYAGTLPMASEGGAWTTTPGGQSRAFKNLWIADGSTFAFLPAKNLTFTLMANASRIAATDF